MFGERLEEERRLVARGLTELGMARLQLGAGEAEDEDRVAPRPLEKVGDELDQRGVGPLQVLEEEHDRELLREPLEEQSPGAEELFLAPGAAFFETEKMRKPRLGEAALLCIGHVLLEGRPQLGAGGGGFFAFHDLGPHPDHLGQCPERHSLAVGKAAPPVPPDLIDEPVEVLVELPAEPRLADAGDPDDRDELRLSLLGAGVEELLHESQLPVAADEWRLEARRT